MDFDAAIMYTTEEAKDEMKKIIKKYPDLTFDYADRLKCPFNEDPHETFHPGFCAYTKNQVMCNICKKHECTQRVQVFYKKKLIRALYFTYSIRIPKKGGSFVATGCVNKLGFKEIENHVKNLNQKYIPIRKRR